MKADNSITDSLSTNCLFHGANRLSKFLRYSLLPSGFIYRQDKETLQPVPMRKYVTFVSLLVNLVLPIRQFMFALYSLKYSSGSSSGSNQTIGGHRDPNQSPVIYYTYYYLPLTILLLNVSSWLFPFVLHHDSLVTILASNSYNLIDKQRQVRVARISFILMVMNEFVGASGYLFFYLSSPPLKDSKFRYTISFALALSNVYFKMNAMAPLMYLSYMGYLIGQNVKRFSQLYIENMLNTEGDENDGTLRALSSKSITTLLTTNTSSATNDQEDSSGFVIAAPIGGGSGLSLSSSSMNYSPSNMGGGYFYGSHKGSLPMGHDEALKGSTKGHPGQQVTNESAQLAQTNNRMALPSISSALASLTVPATVAPSGGQLLIMAGQHLNQEGSHDSLINCNNNTDSSLAYINPNHSPFKPTNEMIFRWNNQLIRSRLRRTVKLLGQMKDDMIDLNRVVSPLFGAHLLSYAHLIIYTASFAVNAISGTTSEDVTMSIAVCLPLVISFTIFVLQVCICFDSVPSELSLMMNRLFDAIVTNQSLKHQCNNQYQLQKQSLAPSLVSSQALSHQTKGNLFQVKVSGGGDGYRSPSPSVSSARHLIPPTKASMTMLNSDYPIVISGPSNSHKQIDIPKINNNLISLANHHPTGQHLKYPSLFVNNLPMSDSINVVGGGGGSNLCNGRSAPVLLAVAGRHLSPQLLSAPSTLLTNGLLTSATYQSNNITAITKTTTTTTEAINNMDDEELCDTWSQYQYARKLSGSIYFNLSGMTPISRRIVLSIFAHALSMLFILTELLRIYAPSQKDGS